MEKMTIMKILGVIVILMSLIGGMWSLDSHYTSATEFASGLKQTKQEVYLQMDINLHRQLVIEEFRIRGLLSRDPNNADLKQQLDDVIKEKEKVKDDIDNALRDGN